MMTGQCSSHEPFSTANHRLPCWELQLPGRRDESRDPMVALMEDMQMMHFLSWLFSQGANLWCVYPISTFILLLLTSKQMKAEFCSPLKQILFNQVQVVLGIGLPVVTWPKWISWIACFSRLVLKGTHKKGAGEGWTVERHTKKDCRC